MRNSRARLYRVGIRISWLSLLKESQTVAGLSLTPSNVLRVESEKIDDNPQKNPARPWLSIASQAVFASSSLLGSHRSVTQQSAGGGPLPQVIREHGRSVWALSRGGGGVGVCPPTEPGIERGVGADGCVFQYASGRTCILPNTKGVARVTRNKPSNLRLPSFSRDDELDAVLWCLLELRLGGTFRTTRITTSA